MHSSGSIIFTIILLIHQVLGFFIVAFSCYKIEVMVSTPNPYSYMLLPV